MPLTQNYPVYNFTEKSKTVFSITNPYTDSYGEAFDKFLFYYDLDIIAPPATKKTTLGKRNERMCRFCIKEFPEVTFKKDAHVMPQLMGNRYLLHDCECDNCNTLFGKYEDSLSKYMGMMRTADAMKGQSGIPDFKSADGKLILRYEKDIEGKQFISIYDGRQAVDRQRTGNTILLKATKPTYIPLQVMKCFYKIGYSLLQPTELQNFHSQRKIITTNALDSKLKNFASVVKFTLPVFTERPMALMFKKKEQFSNVHMPSKVVLLYFGRYMYEYFLIDQRDHFLFTEGEKCQFIYIPPDFEGESKDIVAEKVDFHETGKRVGEVEAVNFTFD